jgi:hypothetical protein
MRRFILCFLFIPLILITLSYCTKQSDFPVLKGPYLGQNPSGMTPEVFAKDIISNDEIQGCYAFMDKGKIFIFNSMIKNDDWQVAPTYIMEYKRKKWTIPERVPFQDLYPYNFSGGVSSDGKTLYFSSLRLPDRSGKLGDANIWMIHKTSGGWSDPLIMEFPINTEYFDAHASITKDGTIYFMSNREGSHGETDLYCSECIRGRYIRAENLGFPVNTKYEEFDPFISPDESYLIYCSMTLEGYGKSDLYISFKTSDGSWSEPENLGEEVNSPDYEVRPSITFDGQYFFFTRGSLNPERSDIYWVNSKIIEKFKPNQPKEK